MEKELGQNSPEIAKYFEELLQPEDEILRKVRMIGAENGLPDIQVARYDARHLEIIVRSMGISNAVEIGTLGGYSGITILRGLIGDKKLYTFELSEKHAAVARKCFELAGYTKEVEIFVGEAVKNLEKINHKAPFDLVFIDADKAGYVDYYKWAKKNLRSGGAILADNTFAWGSIANKKSDDKTVQALQKYNEAVAHDPDFRTTIIPTSEGLTFSVKIR
jgi:caffeoyl-CoA O-methyltransferase